MSPRIRPSTDVDSAPWWDAMQRRELIVQCCQDCQRLRWPARALCNDCLSERFKWVPVNGSGTVASWTVTHRAGAGEAARYVVVLVRLDDQDDILVPGYIDGPTDGSQLSVGIPVQVGFDEVEVGEDGWRLVVLRWRGGQ
jgi:uncharacterized protein